MAKNALEDTGHGKPIKVRKFPWRLWLWALLMTAAAGAGGYLAWHYRGEAETATSAIGPCRTEADKCKGSLDTMTAEAGKHKEAAVAAEKKLTELGTEHAKLQSERDELAKNLVGSKDELAAVRDAKEKTEARLKAIDDIHKKFARMIGTGDMKITSRRGSLVLSLPAEVLFPSGVAELSKEGEIKVLEVGFNLKQFPDRRFMVLGHTDSQPPQKGSQYPDNWALSVARALTVVRVLVQGGVKRENLIVAGAGEHDELVPNTNAASMQRNRRIEIALLPALDELPPLPPSLDDKDGKEARAAAPEPKK